MKKKIIILCTCILFSCKTSQKDIIEKIKNDSTVQETKKLEMKSWHLKSFSEDSVPGVAIKKAYFNLIKKKKGQNVVIAFIDMAVDLDHEDFDGVFWNNFDEIPNNNIDDDGNGYIDDYYGWNFMGNIKGENNNYENHEFVRMVRYYKKIFRNKSIAGIKSNELKRKYKEYLAAKKMLEEKVAERHEYFESDSTYMVSLKKAIKKFASIIPRSEMTIENLDSIGELRNDLQKDIETLKWAVKYNYSVKNANDDVDTHRRYRDIYYNIDYDERKIMGDDSDNLNDNNYGNSLVDNNTDTISHGTAMVGILAACRKNNFGIKGIINNVKIMPIVAAGYGQAHDKELALAIRYAVDNGAQIINISIIKKFSVHKEWIFDAIKYAEKNDVLIVNGAGNDNENIDISRNFYPNDNDYYSNEISNNFMMVGGSSKNLNKNLKSSFSNYGKDNVDIFAPADSVYTTTVLNGYEFIRGTSIAAPIVTGIAALIKSYYPNLKAYEVKKILMDSGTPYDVMVNISRNRKKDSLVPFSSLSKSGKIVNAYNALLMAEEISKKRSK